ncbi:Cof-type HAD-IIB family hydrolase [Actinomycetaceae bacterium L2_0104]
MSKVSENFPLSSLSTGAQRQRVILLDVDGTVVDYSNQLPDSAVQAVRLARAAGHLVYLCTGRSKAEMYPELWEMGIDGMIGANGAYVEHRGEIVMHQSLSSQECREIIDWLEGRGIEFYLEANSGLYGSDGFGQAALPAIRMYAAGKGAPDSESWTVDQAFPDMIYGADLYRDDVNKVSYLLGGPDDFLETAARFPHLTSGTWGGRGSHALFGDLGVSGITKAHAIDVLLAHLGKNREDTVAVGDATVDIPMLEYCGIAIAMGNSSPDVIAVADHVTDDVARDGLYKAFEHYNLLA